MKKQKTKKQNTNKGITLIALVITIIVMLILVAVTITMAINGGLFEYAQRAGTATNEAVANEQLLASGQVTIGGTTYESIDEYIETTRGETMLPYDQTEKDANGVLTANATYTSGNYTAVIPKGFAIVPGLNGTTAISDGLVITDKVNSEGQSIGNEFVWIPVTVTETDTETSIASFYRSYWAADDENGGKRSSTKLTATTGDSLNEPLSSGGYTNEVAEYNEMLKSVYENKGFYIGRYEAGSTTARTYVENKTTEMVVKRDAYPYIYVGWGLSMSDYTSDVIDSRGNQGKGALALSKALYANKDVGVTSTLCYGIQWDAMLDFIKDANHNVIKSTTWGNYKNNPWTITRTTASYAVLNEETWEIESWTPVINQGKVKTDAEDFLLTTGASDSFASKNIFDVAGNVYEWTNESKSSASRVLRGGGYSSNGDSYPAFYRESYLFSYACDDSIGFRPVLYIS